MSQLGWDPEEEYRVDRWPALVALLVCVALYAALPQSLVIKPPWLIPALVLVLVFPLLVTHRRHKPGQPGWTRPMVVATIALINVANIASLGYLIHGLLWPHSTASASGKTLFLSALLVWTTNVIIFGLWFWELDRGGPLRRGSSTEQWPDFQFPQMTDPKFSPSGWHPSYYDYAYLAFTNATAFSPTDAMPLTRTAKLLMTIESGVSMLTVIVVASRAINILH